jgi:hypothetical protein
MMVRKADWETVLVQPMHKWEGNIRTDLKERGCEGVNWIDLAQDTNWQEALVNVVTTIHVS